MEGNKVSIISIIIDDKNSVTKVNEILHENSEYIIGRLGMPHKEKKIGIICIVLDCNSDVLGKIAGKLGMLKGVSSKALTSK